MWHLYLSSHSESSYKLDRHSLLWNPRRPCIPYDLCLFHSLMNKVKYHLLHVAFSPDTCPPLPPPSSLHNIQCMSLSDSLPCHLDRVFFKILFIYFLREGREGKERERNVDIWEKHRSVASCTCPNQGPGPQPRYVPWSGIELVTFCFLGWC